MILALFNRILVVLGLFNAFTHIIYAQHLQNAQNSSQRLICFHTNQCNERGTEIAIFDYMHYTTTLLRHSVYMILPDLPGVHQGMSYSKFQKHFNITLYKATEKSARGKLIAGGVNLAKAAALLRCDVLYMIKDGRKSYPPAFPVSFVYKDTKTRRDRSVPTGKSRISLKEEVEEAPGLFKEALRGSMAV